MNSSGEAIDWFARTWASQPVLTHLVGRDSDLEALSRLILDPEVRLITLTGPGGVGKTRLATALLEQSRVHFEERCAFISLAAVADPALVLGEIARIVAGQATGATLPIESITRALGPSRALLVIDNFEQVTSAAGEILHLLQELPRVQLIVTSREALNLRPERVHHVNPLELNGVNARIQLSAAGRLFVACAQASNSAFHLQVDDIVTINSVCERLDGLPLAIELAAARTRVLTPANLLTRLEEPLRLLVRGSRDLPERQQTMRNAIAWSFELLDPDERLLFGLLSVFAGGAPLTAIEEIWSTWTNRQSSPDVLGVLESLIAKSLVTISSTGQVRYSMLATLREYGLDYLSTIERIDEAQSLHAHWFLELAQASIDELNGPKRSYWMDALDGELANFRAAMSWVLTRDTAELGLRTIEGLWRFWETRGHLSEGEAFAVRVLALPIGDTPPLLRVAAMYGASMMPYRLGRYAIAWERARDCLELARNSGDSEMIGRGLNGCALIAFERGDFEESERAHLESLERSEALNLMPRISTTCVNLGIVYYEDGRYDDAWRVYHRAFELNHSPDRDYDRAFALNGLGIVSHRRGDLDAAKAHLDAAIVIRRLDRDSGALAASLTNLAMVKIDTGGLSEATDLLREALTMRWNREEMRGVNEAIAGLSRIAALEGIPETAALLLGVSDQLSQRGHRLPRPVAAELERLRSELEQRLGLDPFESARQSGRSKPLSEVVELASSFSAGAQIAPVLPASPDIPAHPLLTPREIQVLQLIAEGQSDRQIAETLGISRNTVIRHVANIFLKLDVNSRTVAAMYAFNHGLMPGRP